MSANRPVGVFDSGLGGLSVLYELRRQLPHENFLYLGDTARNPYGPKNAATVARFTLEAASFLEKAGAKLMVIACNTATVAAL
ncbi:MAG: glutamate racemase, partial [Deltaproteobacteria bacterium]|nr:glutamate racemase [Deltaproteobacteria bacterium]